MTTSFYLLTGDIGGTNSRMSLFHAEPTAGCDKPDALVTKYFRNAEHIPDNLEDDDTFANQIVIPFLQHCFQELSLSPGQVQIVACLATAGVVHNNRVHMTNLNNLLVDGTSIADNTSEYLKPIVQCTLINDFVAQGYGCLTLQQHEVRHLFGPNEWPPNDTGGGPKVCIGAGTGLGECYLTCSDENNKYQCFASEGGHVEYAPRNDVEIKMFQYLSKKFDNRDIHRISVERVVSGKGLANVYEFLAQEHPDQIVPNMHDEFLQAGDEQGRVVAVHANPDNPLCQQAMEIMMSAYGCEVGSSAIKWIPTGGLFVTGGLTPKNIQYMEGLQTEFMKSYLHKGRVRSILDRVPLFAVMVEDLGVRGAYQAAQLQYETYLSKSTSTIRINNSSGSKDSPRWILGTAATALVGAGVGYVLGTRGGHHKK